MPHVQGLNAYKNYCNYKWTDWIYMKKILKNITIHKEMVLQLWTFMKFHFSLKISEEAKLMKKIKTKLNDIQFLLIYCTAWRSCYLNTENKYTVYNNNKKSNKTNSFNSINNDIWFITACNFSSLHRNQSIFGLILLTLYQNDLFSEL